MVTTEGFVVDPDSLEYILRKRTADFSTEQLAMVCKSLYFEQVLSRSSPELKLKLARAFAFGIDMAHGICIWH